MHVHLPLWVLELSRVLWQAPPQTFVELHPALAPPGVLESFGASPSLGFPQGQIANYRFPPDPWGGGIHVWKMPDGRLLAHLDRYHPALEPLTHLRKEAPLVWIGLTSTLGGILGGFFGGIAGFVLGRISSG